MSDAMRPPTVAPALRAIVTNEMVYKDLCLDAPS